MTLVLMIGTLLILLLGCGLLLLAGKEIHVTVTKKIFVIYIAGILVSAGFLFRIYGVEDVMLLKYLTLLMIVSVCAWTDLKDYLILNRILLVGFVLRMVFITVEFLAYEVADFKAIILTGILLSIILGIAAGLCKVVAAGGVGYGDIKLLMLMGLFLKTDIAMNVLIFAFIIMFVTVIVLLATKKISRKSSVPFAPFVYLGMIVTALASGI